MLVRYACWLLSKVYIESDNVLNQTRRTEAFRHLSCYELGVKRVLREMAASMAWSMLLASALPLAAKSSAVPWSTEVRTMGKPRSR